MRKITILDNRAGKPYIAGTNSATVKMKKLKKILLIDDSEADNDFHTIVLDKLNVGEKVNVINDSRDALKCWEDICAEKHNSLPDLVFLDINMPAWNGFELLDRMRNVPDPNGLKKKMKIFMLTSSLSQEDQQRAATKYADLISGYFVKPLSGVAVKQIMDQHFN